MINEQISDKIITVCPEFKTPRGGVAQCVSSYSKAVFSNFRAICNSCSGSKFKKSAKCVIAIFKLVWTLTFDRNVRVVHIHTASYNSFRRSSIFVLLSKMMGRKVVLHIHGGGFKEYYASEPSFVGRVLSRCDAIAVLSQSWKSFFDGITNPDRVRVVPNIVETPSLMDVDDDGMFHLLFLGHIQKAKGIFDLVEIINEYKTDYNGRLILDIGGGMFEVERLRQIIKANHLGDIIHFHGWVSGDAKIRLLNTADAFILPSYTEGVPISILEAETYGLPILSTAVGGIPEIVSDGGNGFLFTPGDKVAMKTAVDKLLVDTKLCRALGESSTMIAANNLPANLETVLTCLYVDLLSA